MIEGAAIKNEENGDEAVENDEDENEEEQDVEGDDAEGYYDEEEDDEYDEEYDGEDEGEDSSSPSSSDEDEPDWLKEELLASRTRARWGQGAAATL